MTRKFLEDLGLEKEVVDKILDENSADIGKEIAKTTSAKTELATARGKGIVYEDVDVTTGDVPGSLVVAGRVYKDRLPSESQSTVDELATTLKTITVIETVPAVTRPYRDISSRDGRNARLPVY